VSACGKCDREHVTATGKPACTGHISLGRKGQPRNPRAGQPCRKSPMHGQTKCGAHGGRSKQAKAAGKRRVAEAKAAELMRRFGGPIDTTPTEALLDTVRWTAGYVAWLREKVAEAQADDDLIWGATREVDDAVVVGTGEFAELEHVTKQTREAGANAWLSLLGEWSDRLVKVCAEAIKAGIEERRVRLAEQQGQLVAEVIRKILGDLDLSVEQQARAGNVIPLRLRELAG